MTGTGRARAGWCSLSAGAPHRQGSAESALVKRPARYSPQGPLLVPTQATAIPVLGTLYPWQCTPRLTYSPTTGHSHSPASAPTVPCNPRARPTPTQPCQCAPQPDLQPPAIPVFNNPSLTHRSLKSQSPASAPPPDPQTPAIPGLRTPTALPVHLQPNSPPAIPVLGTHIALPAPHPTDLQPLCFSSAGHILSSSCAL